MKGKEIEKMGLKNGLQRRIEERRRWRIDTVTMDEMNML